MSGHDERRLAREALEAATRGAEPDLGRLLDAAPAVLRRAGRAREARRGLLAATVPVARVAIPRLAAAAALLLLVSAALLLSGGSERDSSTTAADELLLAGNGVSDELIVRSMLGPEEDR